MKRIASLAIAALLVSCARAGTSECGGVLHGVRASELRTGSSFALDSSLSARYLRVVVRHAHLRERTPIAGAWVWGYDSDSSARPEPLVISQTDETGSARLRLPVGVRVRVSAAGYEGLSHELPTSYAPPETLLVSLRFHGCLIR